MPPTALLKRFALLNKWQVAPEAVRYVMGLLCKIRLNDLEHFSPERNLGTQQMAETGRAQEEHFPN